jgi:hypothetical protein
VSDQYHTDADHIEILMQQNKRLRRLLERHEECAAIDEACGQDTKWTIPFKKLVADTRAALSTSKRGDE